MEFSDDLSHFSAPSVILEPPLNWCYYIRRANDFWYMVGIIETREVDVDNEKKRKFSSLIRTVNILNIPMNLCHFTMLFLYAISPCHFTVPLHPACSREKSNSINKNVLINANLTQTNLPRSNS